MEALIRQLRAAGIDDIRTNERLALHTTWKIGGPADLFLLIRTEAQLRSALLILKEHHLPWLVLGRGSNTLVSDRGVRGAVLKLEDEFAELSFQDSVVRVGAAFSFIKLSVLAAKQGLTGLEFAGGIPGSVGGAVYMNAGAHGSDVAQVLTFATLLLPDGTIEQYSNEQMHFAYRHSVLQERAAIVLAAEFKLQYGERKQIAAAMASYKERRQRTQPWQQPCAGSVFRNPEGNYAAQLIEQAGLKGATVGGAQISHIHANFIVNIGHATAQDVLQLIAQVRQTIWDRYEITLLPEVLLIGEF